MIAQGDGGRIINNASGAGKMAPGKDIPLGAYAASKHAVVAITKQMGLELSPHGILVNCVCAGIVDTPMWDLIDREVAKLQGVPVGSVKAGAVASIPVGRIEPAGRCREYVRIPGFGGRELSYCSDLQYLWGHSALLAR